MGRDYGVLGKTVLRKILWEKVLGESESLLKHHSLKHLRFWTLNVHTVVV
jgi:hypothetical protein